MSVPHAPSSEASAPLAPLSLVVLGSGGPAAFGRASTSYLILVDGAARILVDAGSGAFTRLGESGMTIADLDTLLLTHLHIDHAAEVPSIVKARVVTRREAMSFSVFGPQGRGIYPSTSQFIQQLFGAQGVFSYVKTFGGNAITIQATDLPVDLVSTPREISSRDGVIVQAVPTHHGDAPAAAYRIDYHRARLVFSGDIDPSALSNLTHLAQGADVLVFHCAVLDPPGSPAPLYQLHTPPKLIGQVAGAAGVTRVVLSHLSPLIERAQVQVRQSIQASYPGAVLFATDLLRIEAGSASAELE
jgi:ribonuclease BN (tRNA processing enzyme)